VSAVAPEIAIRRAGTEDRSGIIDLLSLTQQWEPGETFERFFRWKHEDNPLGPSPAWIATVEDRVVAFRPFLRWEFEQPDGARRVAVRAVDAATHPQYQRRGIFRQLTLTALDELATMGVDFVFNTPNDKSRPGELKMGWSEVGRLATTVRPGGMRGVQRMLQARAPAERWSVATDAGDDASEVLADAPLEELVTSLPRPHGLFTRRTSSFLRWRYAFDLLRYRAVAARDDVAAGVAIFRVRRRGSAIEAALCDVLVPAGDADSARALERAVARVSRADYVLRLDTRAVSRTGFVRLPKQGPVLVTRTVNGSAAPVHLDAWQLRLGDIELF
jgi:GNAT superfamily N-acetyltransferase